MRLGCDPEVFLISRNTQQHSSVLDKIGADKWNPRQIDGMAQGFTLQEDNVALEFGIPPAATAEEFIFNTRKVMQEGLKALPGHRFSKLSCVVFPAEEMQHPGAHVFGCEPDFNAWTGKENMKPSPPHKYMRSAGGHIHIETELNKQDVIRAMDLYITVPSLFMDDGAQRRQLYGKAGAYRPKSYGVEYRTPSNFWIFKPRLIQWVWDNTARALEAVQHNMDAINECGDAIQHAINNNDKAAAGCLVSHFNLEIV